jgi:hypothetical protein
MQQIQFISKEENSIIYVTVLSSLGYAAWNQINNSIVHLFM